jgi:hypothetical protein
VLLDEYDAETERRFGWVYHAYGHLTVAAPTLASPAAPALGLPPLPDDGLWRMLTARRSGEAAGQVAATWLVDGRPALRLWTVSDAPFEVTTAIAPGQPYPDTQGTLLYRAPGRARRFATVLEIPTGAPQVAGLALAADSTVAVRLANGTARDYRYDGSKV